MSTNITTQNATELSYEVFQAEFEPAYASGQFVDTDDAVARMIAALPDYSEAEVEAYTREALRTLAADNAE